MVQFGTMRDLARKELSEYLDKYAGTKAVVWDDRLTGPLDLIANYAFLKERQVMKMFPLKPGRLGSAAAADVENIIFICRPEVDLMDRVADHVKGEESSVVNGAPQPDFHLLFVPQKSLLCETRLKDKGVYGSFTYLDELAIFWFPLEYDVLSMEKMSIYRDYHLDDDPTCLYPVARALMTLQAVYGVIPHVYGKGKAAKQVYEFMARMRKELVAEEPAVTPQIDSIVILDRQIDLISPLVTQLTYEGLIDELYGIRHNSARLPADKFVSAEAAAQAQSTSNSQRLQTPASSSSLSSKQIVLSSQEEMYAELRDKNFNAVGPCLSRKAKAVSAQFEGRHEAKSVRELKLFVDKLPQMKSMKESLATHTSIAELIKEKTDERQFLEFLQIEQDLVNFQNTDRALDSLEDACCQDEDEDDVVRVMRLVCLQSVVNSGFKPKVLEAYRRLLLQTFGYRHLVSLHNLERLGLLGPQLATRNYAVLRKRLNLTLDDVNEQQPTDIAYVHSVYAPLSVRLVQNFTQPGWRAIRDVLDLLPGETVEEKQKVPSLLRRRRNNPNDSSGSGTKSKVTLVLFVGGCTFAEISALRFLSQLEDSPTEYLVATTAVLNGSTFLRSVMDDVQDAMAM